MKQDQQPPRRQGLEITSDLFVFEDPKRVKSTLNMLFGAFFLGSISILIMAYFIGWHIAFKLSLASAISFGIIILIHRAADPGKPACWPWSPSRWFPLVGRHHRRRHSRRGHRPAAGHHRPGQHRPEPPPFLQPDHPDPELDPDHRHPGIPGGHHQQVQRHVDPGDIAILFLISLGRGRGHAPVDRGLERQPGPRPHQRAQLPGDFQHLQ